MLSNKTIYTIVSRTLIAAANFALVIFSSHIWGDEGRGTIALIMADSSLIIILNNITSGSTLSFHTPKVSKNAIFSIALVGTFFTSLAGAVIFSFIQGFQHFGYLFMIPLLISYSTSLSLFLLGKQNIKMYNIFSVLPPVLILFFLSILYFGLNRTNIEEYFHAYYLSYSFVLIIGLVLIFGKSGFIFITDITAAKKVVSYGTKSEISYFIQFLNYRLAYFFISDWLGLASLGFFSVAVALSEAIWIISKSISAIHYSNIINTQDSFLRIKMTEKAAINSLLFSFIAIVVLYFVPDTVFTYTFGNDFAGVKQLTVYLFPGILAVAISNIYGHYFSGIGKMRILIVKSFLGLITTVVFIFLLLKRFELTGACITLNISYITSSVYLYIMFGLEKKKVLMKMPQTKKEI